MFLFYLHWCLVKLVRLKMNVLPSRASDVSLFDATIGTSGNV